MSSLGVGIDIASVGRVMGLVEREPRFAQRVFSESERRDCGANPRRWASRWAAKEAVRKLAGGGGLRLPAFREVEVSLDAQGAPRARVRGWTTPVALSLSHEGDWAVAVAVAGGAASPGGDTASPGGDTATRPGLLPGALSPPLLMVPPSVRLPDRPADAHKGTFGTVLVVGGAPGFSGAPHMAAMGAARGGAG
ncbi:MAG: 4'-phosphopantetheinyl transferase superfamily protein, partial [Candidatus Dormibacteria bacterium]